MFHNLTERLASLKLTLAILVVFAVAVILFYSGQVTGSWILAVPLGLFALNLMAAVVSKPVFRRQRPLLVFHLGLIALVLLLALGRLTYLRGTVELSDGQEFDGQLTDSDSGPWHPWHISQVRFVNEGFSIEYAQGVFRTKTRNAVRFSDSNGIEQRAEIGEQTPLVLSGYRFYTTPNKGFAPTFLWYPAGGGEPLLGTVHLPSYPLHEYKQARDWQLPGADITVSTILQFNEILLDPEGPTHFKLPQRYKLIVRIGELRREMQPGDMIDLPQGRLVYDGLRSWMGYTVFYDWTIYWLLATCVLAVSALGWHFWRKFGARPWNE